MKTIYSILIMLVGMTIVLNAKPVKNEEKILRTVINVFDIQENTVSNVDFYTTNYGVFGLNIYETKGGVIWPRGSGNQYIFGGGLWFAAEKYVADSMAYRKLVEVTYNPNNGRSWFIPGSWEDGDTLQDSQMQKTKVYFSTDFDKTSGAPLNSEGPNWLLWKNDSLGRYEYGTLRHIYENDVNKRNLTDYPLGPMFVSDEDVVSVYKDSDVRYYDGAVVVRRPQGYPLGLQVESRIYSWGNGEMKDVVIMSYLMQNTSNDTLRNCWFAGVYDADIADSINLNKGASNDRFSYFSDDSSQNLVYGWTQTDAGELGKGLGYIGFSMLESPAVDANGFIRQDKYIFEQSEQLGLKTFKNWSIQNDIPGDIERYNFMSDNQLDSDKGPGDNRVLISTGPFHLLPYQTARLAIALVFAMPAKGGEADGTYEDLTGLKRSAGKKDASGTLATNSSLIGKLNQAKDNYYVQTMGKDDEYQYVANGNDFIYPNPARDYFKMNFVIDESSMTKITLINQFGQEISVIANMFLDKGNHELAWRTEKNLMSNGIYFVKIQSGNDTKIIKLMIVN